MPAGLAPSLVFFNPVPRPRAGVVVADLTWFRRDVLVGPPGERKPRSGAAPSDAEVAAALTGLQTSGAGPVPGGRATGFRAALSRSGRGGCDPRRDRGAASCAGSDSSDGGRSDPLDGRVTRRGSALDNGIVRVELTADGLVSLTDHRTGARHERSAASGVRRRRGRHLQLRATPRLIPVREQRRGHRLGRWPTGRWSARSRPARPFGEDRRVRGSCSRSTPAVRCCAARSTSKTRPPITGCACACPSAGESEALAGGPFGPRATAPRSRRAGSVPTRDAGRRRPRPTASSRWVVPPAASPSSLPASSSTSTPARATCWSRCFAAWVSCRETICRPGRATLAGPPRRRALSASAASGSSSRWRRSPWKRHRSGARLTELWEDTFEPPRALWLRQATALNPEPIDLRLEGEGLVFSSLKPADAGDAIVFRCFNATDSEVAGRLELSVPVARAVARPRGRARRRAAAGGGVEGIRVPRRPARDRDAAGRDLTGHLPSAGGRGYVLACAISRRCRAIPVPTNPRAARSASPSVRTRPPRSRPRHGAAAVYRTRWGEWRTRVRGGRCVFLRDNVCTIHAESYYPAVCRGFPWTDAETGGPYEYDRTICPEFILRPELVHINRSDLITPSIVRSSFPHRHESAHAPGPSLRPSAPRPAHDVGGARGRAGRSRAGASPEGAAVRPADRRPQRSAVGDPELQDRAPRRRRLRPPPARARAHRLRAAQGGAGRRAVLVDLRAGRGQGQRLRAGSSSRSSTSPAG